jgi:hypothetical protein
VSEYQKPLPRITPDNRPFWEAARRHELRLQRCGECGKVWFPPGPVCHECLSERFEWERMTGRGKVSSWVVFHQRYFESFAADIPYNVVQVELEEGLRLTANLIGVPNDQIEIGMPVEVIFDDVTPKITLPRFRPLSG